ncbi:hypothetical protein [uncultured Mediterranean phage uvMED]|nr:hypothetical protein [uncultured Mediterranean phage uvMED]BAQ87184.1 hypothetical protein [uncultured Mediterranean phage uvMED]BAQ87326.1 hypothetical protein [uncultured Mediterranean phage uvMED]
MPTTTMVGIMEKIKKLEKILENLTDLYYETNEILGTDDNDASRGISCAEDMVINEIDYLKKQTIDTPETHSQNA